MFVGLYASRLCINISSTILFYYIRSTIQFIIGILLCICIIIYGKKTEIPLVFHGYNSDYVASWCIVIGISMTAGIVTIHAVTNDKDWIGIPCVIGFIVAGLGMFARCISESCIPVKGFLSIFAIFIGLPTFCTFVIASFILSIVLCYNQIVKSIHNNERELLLPI